MVAKARGDLFDVSVGGAGFHFTSHLIALVALFIACFAIAGYVMFRNDSIPSSALKDGDPDFEDITATSLTLSGDLTYGGITESTVSVNAIPTTVVDGTPGTLVTFPSITIPANSSLQELFIMTTGTVNLDNATGEHMDVRVAITYGTSTDLAATVLHTGLDSTDAAFSTTLPIRLVTSGSATPVNSACSVGTNVGGSNATFVGTNLLLSTVASDTMILSLSGGGNDADDTGSGIDVTAGASMKLVAVFRKYA